ncbi:TetR/AcrR family transcriptional regulator [Amycolatopsis thailandensis]|uniref:TetR/AcrR family transcriptional regulator n=1 Tax=Amycolatopsis thailandensis TaxID=589330 RepID=UPI0036306D4D
MSEGERVAHRLEISRAAATLFLDRGVDATTGEDIAAVIGVSARTLRRWFPTKENCVEPLVKSSIDAFVACLSRWPVGVSLDKHVLADYRPPATAAPGDADLVLAIIRLSLAVPSVRAICLAAYVRAEAVLANAVALRQRRDPSEVGVRVQAAALAAALRIATEDLAVDSIDMDKSWQTATHRARLSAALDAAMAGVPIQS